ncbi:MAG: oxidoreductase, partial [Algiphilus sp.]
DRGKAERARDGILQVQPDARLELLDLDLADLGSVQRAAERFRAQHDTLDILCNNAGVLGLPLRHTRDGFEMLFGVNHLGHFAFTAHLLPALRQAAAARVVTVSSITHRRARLPMDDMNWVARPYRKAAAYGQSKLANLLFMCELDRRLQAAELSIRSVAAHPGIAATEIADNMGALLPKALQPVWKYVIAINNRTLAQPASMGVLPTLFAATDEAVEGGALYGPDGWFQIRGYPKPVQPAARACDDALARALWVQSEALTGVTWAFA